MYFLLQEIQELREQLRDVMFFMEAQQKLSETSEVSQTELQQSQVIVGGGASGTSPSPRSKKGRKKDRWEAGPLHWNVFVKDVHSSINMWMMHLHVHTLIITRCLLIMYTYYYSLCTLYITCCSCMWVTNNWTLFAWYLSTIQRSTD